ncbi:HAD family hydrolase [Qipengyuania sp. RANM35]|uniref:HAD family hydrolase n=1 Tax=Qipengyuania sp. RANM35 TaxID=3068635 RepID=UPI0034DB3531
MAIQAVVFDVGKVLYQWDLSLLMRKVESDPERLRELVEEVVTVDWHSQHDAGVPLAEMVPARIAEYPHHAEALRAYATRFNETIPGPVPGSHDLVSRLDARGVPIFGITNFGAEFWAEFRPTAPVFDVFRDIVVSGEEKLAKPDPAIFKLAERRFGHPANAMLFIDDSLANVESAKACGWQVHHFADAQTLEADLGTRGLL